MKEEELLVGIDFSLNSPSITIKYMFENEEHYKFCSFFNSDGKDWLVKDIKAFKNHKALNNLNDVCLMPYERKITASDYTEKESQKIADAQQLSQLKRTW